MATTMVAAGGAAAAPAIFCGPPQQTDNLHGKPTLSFSASSFLSPLFLQSRGASSCNSAASSSSCFSSVHSLRSARRRGVVECKSTDERTPPTAETNVFVRAAWYGSEAFGKVVAGFRPSKEEEVEEESVNDGPIERKEAVELLRVDLDRSYFVTGNMATGIYEEDCEFADPFVSFKGLKRFKQNVGNLGSFMEESSLKLVDWQEYEDRIFAKWRFNCVLALPWRPILAASGSTEYFFSNDSGKIYKHIETWDISPMDGLRQLFKPNPRRKAEK
ncbi:unnamed protein product [Calypogeia fissa]